MQSHIHRSGSPRYDVLIVGSGTAGLLAAHEIIHLRPGSRVLVADAGFGPSERGQLSGPQMTGYGGAGLYLGGRLYLGPATIPVMPPGSAHAELRIVLEGPAYAERAAAVDALFVQLGVQSPIRPAPQSALAEAIAAARTAGVEYITSYPARLLTAAERRTVLEGLLATLTSADVNFTFGTRVEEIAHTPDGFAAALQPITATANEATRRVRARALVLAPGRLGAEWLAGTVRALGARVVALPTAAGVRLEIPASAYASLTDVNPDPRLQLALPTDAVVKTYATCPGGTVAAVTRYGNVVASGMPLPPGLRHASTTIAVLVQPGAHGAASTWQGLDAVARRANARTPGALIVQRLGDVRSYTATSAQALAATPIRPTCPDALADRLDDLYPQAYWDALDMLLARIERLAPGTDRADALVYAPAEERFWAFPTGDLLQTDVAGLFVAGDGPGHSQGVIQAGVSGTLAGAGVARYLDAQ
jgi:uncharacterized FAD-dependent dehydrogenase